MRLLLALLSLLFLLHHPAQARWVRIATDQTGLYVLTDTQLRAWGFSEPSRVGVYGFGGAMLSEELGKLTSRKLAQVPLYSEAGARYFFAHGTTSWSYLPSEDFFCHQINPYTRQTYYLLSDEAAPEVMRERVLPASSGMLPPEAATYTACYLHELEEYTPSQSGRHLFGEDLTRTPELTFALPSSIQATDLRVRLAYMAYPQAQSASLSLSTGQGVLLTSQLTRQEMQERMPAGPYHVFGRRKVSAPSPAQVIPAGEAPQLTLRYLSPATTARLDFIEANLTAPLRYRGAGQLLFTRARRSGAPVGFALTAPSDTHLFRVDDAGAPLHLRGSLTLPAEPSNHPPTYLALRLSEAYSPTFVAEEVAPTLIQESPAVDLLIITTEALRGEAERLASYYRGQGKGVLVASQQQLFNEFNGGTPDASVYRLAAYHLYQRARQAGRGEDFQLLLFGDGAQDNRRLTEPWQGLELASTELLLTYQSRNSLDLDSYTTDDYFAMLAPEEDRPTPEEDEEDHLPELSMTIGVGRLPVRTSQEARAVVEKIIRYSQGEDFGAWRTRATFVADNGDANRHLRQSLAVSEALSQVAPELSIQRIYLADYPRQSRGGQVTVPGASRAFQQALDEGTLVLTYSGHGGPRSWTDEQLLTSADVRRFAHSHLPLWLAATCDFAPFDAPTTSAGEEVLLHPSSGGIAILATTRIAWDLPNQALTTAVLQALFTPGASGKLRPLGSAIREAKNKLRRQSYPLNRLNFVLLGSPLLQLPYPATKTRLTELAGRATTYDRLTLAPDRPLTLTGEVLESGGGRDSSFTGTARIRLYDCEQRYQTRDNFDYGNTHIPPVNYRAHKELLLDETVPVQAGVYTLTAPLPQGVTGAESALRLEVYAVDEGQQREAYSAITSIYWGEAQGGDALPLPEPIRITRFCLGGRETLPHLGAIASGARLELEIQAPQGLNRSRAHIGTLPLLSIDQAERLTYDLSEAFTAVAGQAGRYRLSFALPELSEGAHELRLRLWDTAGQLTELTASFTLLSGLLPEVTATKLYPSVYQAGQPLTLEVESPARAGGLTLEGDCFDLTGKRLAVLPPLHRSYVSGRESYDLSEIGARLPAGSYLLRLRLRAGHAVSPYQTLRLQVQPAH